MGNNCRTVHGSGLILIVVVILQFFVFGTTLPTGDRGQIHRDLLHRTYDFSTTCDGNIILMLDGKQLNRRNLKLTASDVAVIVPALFDQSLEDRMDVWCRLAKLTQDLVESIGEQINIFDVNDLKLFQDDILLTKSSFDSVIDNDPNAKGRLKPLTSRPAKQRLDAKGSRVKRKVITLPGRAWENATIPWRFDPQKNFSEAAKLIIMAGIKSWETNTCLRFPRMDNPGAAFHIRFTKSGFCFANVGKDVSAVSGQAVSIADHCTSVGAVVHELGHVIGFNHEQARPDRDRYVNVDFQNVLKKFLAALKANSWRVFRTAGVPYDYSSVMHYSAKAFAKDRSKDTVIPLDPDMRGTLGQREHLSFWDAKVANVRYCNDACGSRTLEWDRCQHNGYRNPNKCAECLCPSGLAPPFCEEVVTNLNCGASEYNASKAVQVFKSPGFDGAGHPLETFCAYRFKAPDGMRVKLKFKSLQMQENGPSCKAFVEVRYQHMALAGPRYCGSRPPSKQFVSHGETAMVTFLTKAEQNQGFELEYSAEPCGGCSSSPSHQEPACLRTELFDCSFWWFYGQIIENTCFDVRDEDKIYCCSGYVLSGRDCVASAPKTESPQ